MRSASLLGLLFSLAACGGTTHAGDDDDDDTDGVDAGVCSDPDGDRYGEGTGCLGDDCDENNPNVHECDCGEDGRAHVAGCACDALQPEVCYEGTPGTAGVGACTGGLRSCQDGRWTGCEGQVIDQELEDCDYDDNDCDGQVDEGVLGPCGDCSSDCESIDYGPPDGTPFDPDDSNSSGVIETPEGYITLSQTAVSSHLIWIANSVDGTISKFDTRTREELGRFRTGPLGSSGGMWSGNGDNPSRTSVNYFGDAYIANRAFNGQASATKILADLCPDNGDGVVDTSNGGDNVLPWDDEPEDDCIAWNTPAGNVNDLGRSIASQMRQELDGGSHEYAWLGLFEEQKYVEIDGETGELTGEEAVFPTVTPYGAAIDADGNLWSSSLSSRIGRFDTNNPADVEEINVPSGFVYGITVDALGHVWCNGGAIDVYKPEEPDWDSVFGSRYENGGIGVDAEGIVWTHHDSGTIQRVDSNDPALPLTTISSGRGGRGVAVDSDGFIWAINWDRGVSDGDVTIIDPAEPENVDTVCCESINNSYTYSDMTGVQLGIATAPSGTYEMVVEGCEAPDITSWVGFAWEGDLPAETGMRVEVRTAPTLPELAETDWILAGEVPPDESPLDLRAAFGEIESELYLGVRLTLLSYDRDALPVIYSIGLQRSCSNPFG
ncbi:MAG: hypothetical protein HYY06_28645 [Deltaproteobacteria bacterium]|nr:hypothetical protein [Deltaproteobacteria bacterium]